MVIDIIYNGYFNMVIDIWFLVGLSEALDTLPLPKGEDSFWPVPSIVRPVTPALHLY